MLKQVQQNESCIFHHHFKKSPQMRSKSVKITEKSVCLSRKWATINFPQATLMFYHPVFHRNIYLKPLENMCFFLELR